MPWPLEEWISKGTRGPPGGRWGLPRCSGIRASLARWSANSSDVQAIVSASSWRSNADSFARLRVQGLVGHDVTVAVEFRPPLPSCGKLGREVEPSNGSTHLLS